MTHDLDIQALLIHLGIQARRVGRRYQARCPSPEHPDKKPSWSIEDQPGQGRHGSHHCFACGFGGGPWELVAAVRQCTLAEAATWLGREFGGKRGQAETSIRSPEVRIIMPSQLSTCRVPAGVLVPSADGSRWFAPALDYLVQRGLTGRQIRRWGIGYALTGKLAMRIFVPVVTGDRLRTWVARAFVRAERRYLKPSRERDGDDSRSALWGEPGWRNDLDTCTVAEGIFSALALERADAPNPCAILGSGVSPHQLAMIGTHRRILVATDPDKAGDKAAAEILDAFGAKRVVRVKLACSPDDAGRPGFPSESDLYGWVRAAK